MLYDANKTMKMLGCNIYAPIFRNGVAADDFNDVLNAHVNEGSMHYFDIAMDAFMLGYIYGKRAERARRKKQGGTCSEDDTQ